MFYCFKQGKFSVNLDRIRYFEAGRVDGGYVISLIFESTPDKKTNIPYASEKERDADLAAFCKFING